MISVQREGNIAYTIAKGKLTKEDYNQLIPILEDMVTQFKTISWYFEMRNFEGWEAGAFAKDLAFDFKHWNDFQKIAMVGVEQWERMLTQAMKPFTTATIKFFTLADAAKAKEWVKTP